MLMNLLFFTSITLCPDLVGHRTDRSSADEDDFYNLAGGKKIKEKKLKPAGAHRLLPAEMKCSLLNLDFVANAFDDQYRGCSEILEEEIMPKILTKEKAANPFFGFAWEQAESQWNQIKPAFRLPVGFKDEFGTAIRVYTTDWPKGNPIYKMFNGNVSTGGRSRDHYMQRFHYKALHFYLTRALQILKKNSTRRHQTYRGTDRSFEVSEAALRFGRFTSSSLNVEVAKEYDSGLLFEIITRFGVDIHKISFFPEEREVLIPVAEKFNYAGKKGNFYVLNSSCELCSYFNCAYLGGEKRDAPVCSTSTV